MIEEPKMKRLWGIVLVGFLALPTGCQDYLDVNTNPNAPQDVSANLYLPPMVHWMVTSPQFDGRFVGHITHEALWKSSNTSPAETGGQIAYAPSSNNRTQ